MGKRKEQEKREEQKLTCSRNEKAFCRPACWRVMIEGTIRRETAGRSEVRRERMRVEGEKAGGLRF